MIKDILRRGTDAKWQHRLRDPVLRWIPADANGDIDSFAQQVHQPGGEQQLMTHVGMKLLELGQNGNQQVAANAGSGGDAQPTRQASPGGPQDAPGCFRSVQNRLRVLRQASTRLREPQ